MGFEEQQSTTNPATAPADLPTGTSANPQPGAATDNPVFPAASIATNVPNHNPAHPQPGASSRRPSARPVNRPADRRSGRRPDRHSDRHSGKRPSRQRSRRPLVLAVIVGVLLISIALIAMALLFLPADPRGYQTATHYEIGGDQLPSIRRVVGEREITNFSTANTEDSATQVIQYVTDGSSLSDVHIYCNNLIAHEGYTPLTTMDFSQTSATGYQIGRVSPGDPSKIITVTIDYQPGSYTLTLERREGSLSAH